MADYLKKFATQSEYDAYIEAGYPKPNVSYIVDTDEIIFTNYQDGEDAPDTVVTGMKIADFTGTIFNKGYTYITEAYIPDGVTTIGVDAFMGFASLTSVRIPDGVTRISSQAFASCSALTSVNIPDGVIYIDNNAFSGCTSLTSIDIPASVTSIGYRAFQSCSGLTSVTIPDAVATIGVATFLYCSSLASATIGSSVTTISNEAFSYCTALTSVTVRATTPPTLGTNAFSNTHANLVIYVPAESVEAYKAAANWSAYASRIQAITE